MLHHLLQLYNHTAGRDNHSSGVLFLDFSNAFYAVVRPLVISSHNDTDVLSKFFFMLGVPQAAVSVLVGILDGPSAMDEAGVPELPHRIFDDGSTSTYFHTAGLETVVWTFLGTRPGESNADSTYNFAASVFLKGLIGDSPSLDWPLSSALPGGID